jgi:archaeosortase A (PGF-CTERM-specific)
MTTTLWISLILLAAGSILPIAYNSRFVIGGTGWIFLSFYRSLQPGTYFEIQDYVNAFLVIAAAVISIFIAYIMFKAKDKKDSSYEVFISFSRAASVGGLLYFLFAEINFLNTWIISTVTDQAIWVTGKFGIPVLQVAWNQFAINGIAVEIILACTAIVSIALFSGIISSAKGAPAVRKLISEHIITKAGSLLALFLISYMVLKTLPEISNMIDGVVKLMKIELGRLWSN